MAKKRKNRVAQTPAEPETEIIQSSEQDELESEKLQEPEPETMTQPDSETVPDEAVVEDVEVEEQVVEGEEDPELEEEETDVGNPECDGGEDNIKGEKSGQESERPGENSLLENGVQNEEAEDGLEEEPLEKLLEPFSKDQLMLLIKGAVAKHPDVRENVIQLAGSDPSHCKVFVHGLGWDANADTLTSVFGKYGEIDDCKVVRDKNSGKSKGYGFILFRHRDGARRALKQPQKLIEGRMTSCQLASAGPVQASPAPAMPAFSSPNSSEHTQRKIYVSNVSAEIDPNKLFQFFSRFGEIEEGPLGLDKQTGKPKGFCLFVYKTFESAKRALEEPHKNFEGQILHCQRAIDGPKYGRGYFNQHGAPQQHHHAGHQGYYHPAKKGRFSGTSGAVHPGGHIMAPGAGPGVPPMGFNPAVAPAALGQAVAALLATQGAGLGIGNFLGGIGPNVNPQGVPPIINNASYGSQGGAGGFAGQAGMQGGYGGQAQFGPGGARPHQGGAPYMGHGH